MKRLLPTCRSLLLGLALLVLPASLHADIAPSAPAATTLEGWNDAIDAQLFDYYQSPEDLSKLSPASADWVAAGWSSDARALLHETAPGTFAFAVGHLQARMQQALTLEMARAVHEGRVSDAQAFRAELTLPRGVSAAEGELVLQNLQGDKRDDAAKLLVCEAITWQTTRVRQLLDDSLRSVDHDSPMPNRLQQRLGEALGLADVPAALRKEAGLNAPAASLATGIAASFGKLNAAAWSKKSEPLAALRDNVEGTLPSLLSPKEKERRERLLLKLVTLISKEYMSGVRDGQVTVPLEYHEAESFTQQARQITAELVPLWLAGNSAKAGESVRTLDGYLEKADQQIAEKAAPEDVAATLASAGTVLTNDFGITLHLNGTTADIVDEVMLQTRETLSKSLVAAMNGNWAEAERLRVEAYTTYDPDLESRLMPRDPELATNIERLLLDGVDQPGVKLLLDRHVYGDDLSNAYARVITALDKATAVLKSDVSPGAAVLSASSIVVREGLEGLLVIIAILAGLRGTENRQRRTIFWFGVLGSVAFTLLTWILSRTLLTSLRNYGEVIEAVTGLLAIAILLLITNWLFHQVYWRQWVTSLKAQVVEGSSWFSLFAAGFLVGYREGFETVLFLQGLVMDAGGRSVGVGVLIGTVVLVALGIGALKLGMKLPYFHILLGTAAMIGLVLVTFVGGTVRSAQTIGWLPVHRLSPGSWPLWLGTWLGIHNTWESVAIQVLTIVAVLGTWRVARWQVKRKAAKREAARATNGSPSTPRRNALPQIAMAAVPASHVHDCNSEPEGCGGLGCAISCPGPITGDAKVEHDPKPAGAVAARGQPAHA